MISITTHHFSLLHRRCVGLPIRRERLWRCLWLRSIVLYIHILAAIFWVGEMLFLSTVVRPYSRRLEPRERTELFTALGQHSRPWAWGAMVVLVVTGLLNVTLAGIPLTSLVDPHFYRTPLGATLDLKVLLVIAMIAVALWHDSLVGTRAARLRGRLADHPKDPALTAAVAHTRRMASWLGRMALLLALVVVFLAVHLALYL